MRKLIVNADRLSVPRTVHGLPLPARAKEMGVTGMIHRNDQWFATFAGHPNSSFLLPQAVSNWLLGRDRLR